MNDKCYRTSLGLERYAAFLNQIYISIGKVNSQNTKGLVS